MAFQPVRELFMAIKIINYSTDPRLSSVDIYGNTNLVIATAALLRTTEPSYSGQIITLLGITTAGVGSGNFRADLSDTTTVDDNSTIIVTVGLKRWKRVVLNGDTNIESWSTLNTQVSNNTTNIANTIPTFDDFGVIGRTGIVQSTDYALNSTGIDFALTECLRLGYKEIRFKQGKNYGISRRINLTNYSGLTIIQDNASLIPAPIVEEVTPRFDIYYAEGSATTGWKYLSGDKLPNAFNITTNEAIVGAVVGSWLDIKSDAIFSGNNPKLTKKLVTRKIVAISGTTYTFDKPLNEDFLVSDNAQAGLATIVENIRLINPSSGTPDYDDITGDYDYVRQFSRGVNFERCSNILIESPRFQGNKLRDELSTSGGRTGVLLNAVYGGIVKDSYYANLLGYGVAAAGNSEDIYCYGGYGEDVRHVFDTTWASSEGLTLGRCRNINFYDFKAYKTTHSGGSTHAEAVDVSIYNFSSDSCGTQAASNGLIIRNDDTFVQGGTNRYNTNDGVRLLDGGANATLENVTAKNNIRHGFSNALWADYNNCKSFDNGNSGYATTCGTITGGKSERNGYAVFMEYVSGLTTPQTITNLYAPFSTDAQTVGVLLQTGYVPQQLTINSNKFIGYNDFVISVPSDNNSDIPLSDGHNQIHYSVAGGRLRDEVTLSAGVSSAILTTSVRNLEGTTTRGRLLSNIPVKARLPVNSGSYSVEIIDKTSFIIKSSNPLDASTVMWEITGI